MPRKIFWGLWMTVWPAVALIPPLVTAQATRQSTPPAAAPNVVVTSPQIDPAPAAQRAPVEHAPVAHAPVERTPAERAVVDLSLESPAVAPQLTVPADSSTETLVEAPEIEAAPVESQAPRIRTARTGAETITAISDANLFEETEPLPPTSSAPAAPTRRLAARQVSPRRTTSPALSAQEQTAQKLIHERAMLRAQQRHTRLEMKQWGGPVMPRRPVRQTTAWQPQLTQPDWLAEMDQITNP